MTVQDHSRLYAERERDKKECFSAHSVRIGYAQVG